MTYLTLDSTTVVTSEMVTQSIINGQFTTAELEKLVALGQQILHEQKQADNNIHWFDEMEFESEDAYYDRLAELYYYRNTVNAGYTIG